MLNLVMVIKMVNTIEIAPHIVAYELAKFLDEYKHDYITDSHYDRYGDGVDTFVDQETLRMMILDFLKDDKNGQVTAI